MERDLLIAILLARYAREHPRATSLAKETYAESVAKMLDDLRDLGVVLVLGTVVQ